MAIHGCCGGGDRWQTKGSKGAKPKKRTKPSVVEVSRCRPIPERIFEIILTHQLVQGLAYTRAYGTKDNFPCF